MLFSEHTHRAAGIVHLDRYSGSSCEGTVSFTDFLGPHGDVDVGLQSPVSIVDTVNHLSTYQRNNDDSRYLCVFIMLNGSYQPP